MAGTKRLEGCWWRTEAAVWARGVEAQTPTLGSNSIGQCQCQCRPKARCGEAKIYRDPTA